MDKIDPVLLLVIVGALAVLGGYLLASWWKRR